jgi:hypothetical protein
VGAETDKPDMATETRFFLVQRGQATSTTLSDPKKAVLFNTKRTKGTKGTKKALKKPS